MGSKNKNKTVGPQMNADECRSETAAEQTAEVPTFTIRADSHFGIRAMIAVVAEARLHCSAEDYNAARKALREFDLYEEGVRTAPEVDGE